MLTIIILLAVIVVISMLPHWHHHAILSHLKRHGCDPKLYLQVRLAKDKLASNGKFAGATRIENSTKSGLGRYEITVLLSEFSEYSEEDRMDILRYLGFTSDQYQNFLTNRQINTATNIILGVNGNDSASLYLDCGGRPCDIAFVCLESTGRLTRFIKDHAATEAAMGAATGADVLRVESSGKVIGYHYKLRQPFANEKGDQIYRVDKGADGLKTFYTRPDLILVGLHDFISSVRMF
jgi:hypothetical protein